MSLLDFSPFLQKLAGLGLKNLQQPLSCALEKALTRKDGNLPHWLAAYNELPELAGASVDLNSSAVSIFARHELSPAEITALESGLRALCPWRKGPFSLFGLHIDSEWRSDFKWDRLVPHLTDLNGNRILDVGCGNGYHVFRMLGAGAEVVIGADPSLLFLTQFSCIKKYCPDLNAFLLPLGIEELPESELFDKVFSMGVLYHRKSPFDFLRQLKMQLRPGGELILETLVIEGDENSVLVPQDRYARMKNVWFIPSPAAMLHWLSKAGFVEARVVDICPTTVDEQRATAWMSGESLQDCLNAEDSALTVEGYPAPLRAVFIARR